MTEEFKRGEYVNVSNTNKDFSQIRIFLNKIEGALRPYQVVAQGYENNFLDEEPFQIESYMFAKSAEKTILKSGLLAPAIFVTGEGQYFVTKQLYSSEVEAKQSNWPNERFVSWPAKITVTHPTIDGIAKVETPMPMMFEVGE